MTKTNTGAVAATLPLPIKPITDGYLDLSDNERLAASGAQGSRQHGVFVMYAGRLVHHGTIVRISRTGDGSFWILIPTELRDDPPGWELRDLRDAQEQAMAWALLQEGLGF